MSEPKWYECEVKVSFTAHPYVEAVSKEEALKQIREMDVFDLANETYTTEKIEASTRDGILYARYNGIYLEGEE